MSAPASDEPEEPDLTALLDLVLQLVMFFIAVARIDSEQKNQAVVLPQASIARALNKDYSKLVIINLIPADEEVDETGQVPVNHPVRKVKYSVFQGYFTEEYTELGSVKSALETKLDADKRATPDADWKDGKGRSLVVLRAHRNCNFRQVFDVMTTARTAGYTDVQLRAFIPNSAR